MRAKWKSIRPWTQWQAITDVLHLARLIWHFCGGTAGGRFDASAALPPAFQHREEGKAGWLYFLVTACSTVWDTTRSNVCFRVRIAVVLLLLPGVFFCSLLIIHFLPSCYQHAAADKRNQLSSPEQRNTLWLSASVQDWRTDQMICHPIPTHNPQEGSLSQAALTPKWQNT